MAAFPIQSTYLEASVADAPVRSRGWEIDLGRVSEWMTRTVAMFVVGTVAGAAAWGMAGNVILEKTRLQAEATQSHLDASVSTAKNAEGVLLEAKKRDAVDKWAARNGFVDSEALLGSSSQGVAQVSATVNASRGSRL